MPMPQQPTDVWATGAAYEPYVGRWSRLVAREFLAWLDERPDGVWVIPDPDVAVAEMARVARAKGTVAAYVWDYAAGMQMIRRFWDAVVDLDPAAASLDEARRFPLCNPAELQALWRRAGLQGVEVRALESPTPFRDFDDF